MRFAEFRSAMSAFVIVAAYPDARLPFYHADFYRLGDESELGELGLDDAMGLDSVCVVEWADLYLDALPVDHLRVVAVAVLPQAEKLFISTGAFEPFG